MAEADDGFLVSLLLLEVNGREHTRAQVACLVLVLVLVPVQDGGGDDDHAARWHGIAQKPKWLRQKES